MKVACATTRVALRNVLLATDFSPVSELALRFAAALARRYASKLWVTNVISPAETALVPPEYWGSSQQVIEEAAERQLQELGRKLKGPHELLLEHGGVSEAVFEEIAQLGIDLLIVGTHGREGVDRFLMGSKAEEIFRRVSCPVLTVGPGVTVRTAEEAEFKEIIFATHFGPESLAAGPYAISLAHDFQARLTLLHVMDERDFDLPTDPQIVLRSRMERLHKIIPADARLEHEPQYVVEFGKAAEQILRVAKERNADLIVLGAKSAHGHTGAATHFASATAHTVVSHAACPVMTVRGSAQ